MNLLQSTVQRAQTSTERIVPEQVLANDINEQLLLNEHLERYEFAAKYLKPGRILDLACGVGYGTRLLIDKLISDDIKSDNHTSAVGVDLSDEAIEYAKQHYAKEQIYFLQHDGMIYFDKDGFDNIVSLETVEHMPKPDDFVKHLVELLRPGGILIASVPTTPSKDINPFHLNDFTERSFRNMFMNFGLKEIACLRQVQPYLHSENTNQNESRVNNKFQNLMSYYIKHPLSIGKRILSTLRYGFTNRYLTVAWQKGI